MSILAEIIAEVFFGLIYVLFRSVFYYIGLFFAKLFGIKGYDIKIKRVRIKVRRFIETRSNFKGFIGFIIFVVLFYITLYIIKFFRDIN